MESPLAQYAPRLRSLLPPTDIITFFVSAENLLEHMRLYRALALQPASYASASIASFHGQHTFYDLAWSILREKGYAAVSGARVSMVNGGRRTLLLPAAESTLYDKVAAAFPVHDEISLMLVTELRVTLPLSYIQNILSDA